MDAAALAAAVPFPGKATRISCKGQRKQYPLPPPPPETKKQQQVNPPKTAPGCPGGGVIKKD